MVNIKKVKLCKNILTKGKVLHFRFKDFPCALISLIQIFTEPPDKHKTLQHQQHHHCKNLSFSFFRILYSPYKLHNFLV